MRNRWSTEFLNDLVETEFLALPKDMRVRCPEIALALERIKEIDHG